MGFLGVPYNLFRLLSRDLDRYSQLSYQSLFDKFIFNAADIDMESNEIKINLKKKRNLPLILKEMSKFNSYDYSWLNN